MRNAMLISAAIFSVDWYLLMPFGNDWRWASLYVHSAARTSTRFYYFPVLLAIDPCLILVKRKRKLRS